MYDSEEAGIELTVRHPLPENLAMAQLALPSPRTLCHNVVLLLWEERQRDR